MYELTDIVLVDDDDLYREALSVDLADRGFKVSCYSDGPSFLAAVSNGVAARVALLDWALPEMTGFELLGALRERGIDLPVVFLTGYSLAERELQALDRGAPPPRALLGSCDGLLQGRVRRLRVPAGQEASQAWNVFGHANAMAEH